MALHAIRALLADEQQANELEPTAANEYIALVIRVQPDAAGVWHVQVHGHELHQTIYLCPATFVLRLWHEREAGLLRGTLRLAGSEQRVAIQSQAALLELLRTWFGLAEPSGPAS